VRNNALTKEIPCLESKATPLRTPLRITFTTLNP
jgi:hypothetical protein